MSAGDVSRPSGRAKTELAQAAARVRIRDAIRSYRSKSRLPEEFSYSLELGRHYDTNMLDDRVDLLRHYSDGRSPVYMIAITDTDGEIHDEDAVRAAADCINRGFVPFIGRWIFENVLHEDVSVAVDHGTTDEDATGLLRVFRQRKGLKITRGGYRLLHNPEHAP